MKTKPRNRKGKPDPAILADIIKRVVEAADPEKIVLFGSAARGTMGPDSDLDLLVIKGGKFKHDRVTRDLPQFVRRDRCRCRGRDSGRSRALSRHPLSRDLSRHARGKGRL